MHPYHYIKVQESVLEDMYIIFCQWLLCKVETDNIFTI